MSIRSNATLQEGSSLLAEEDGCCFALETCDGTGPAGFCNRPRQVGSTYCPEHHALCHVASGSAGEARQLHEIEALATIVGGKRGREAHQPPRRLLRRLRRVERLFLRPHRS